MWQGAEAKVELIELDGKVVVRKWRFPKTYRHPTLDARLTRQRTATEARALDRAAAKGLPVPAPILVVPEKGLLVMEHIADSATIKEALWKGTVKEHIVADGMAEIIARLHSSDTIHGDLTTSNFLVQPSGKVFAIDFGLSAQSTSVEDKAVDLYVLERAVKATHSMDHPELFGRILESYWEHLGNLPNGTNLVAGIKRRFEEVRARGRKRM